MDLNEFRRQKDDFFRSPESPLKPEQQTDFQGLRYYPENPTLRLTVGLDTNTPHDFMMMQTSTGSQRRYTRAGKISFTVAGQPAELWVYQDDHGYFLPFRDATGQDETYGAGRYLEPDTDADGKLLVDFNLAYNPYCAYNERFSCPIPPRENWLTVRIEAGEKNFHPVRSGPNGT